MSLATLQRDFQSWLTVEAPDAARRLGGAGTPGLAVYINNYRGQLMACLTDSFTTLRAWLGDRAFEAAAASHIDRSPPTSWTLDDYALNFPGTVGALYPDDPEIAELAQLELDMAQAFVGPDAPSVDVASLGDIDWQQAVFRLVPTFTLRPIATNAAAIWSAINADATPPAASALGAPVSVVLWRQAFAPTFRTVDGLEAHALAMVSQGDTFGEICGAIAETVGEEAGPATAGDLLARWLTSGMIAEVVSGRQ